MSSTTTVLGKRKTRKTDALILHLSTSESGHDLSDNSYRQSESEAQFEPAAKKSFILVNGSLVQSTSRKYKCTFAGCDKAYTKPCRLEEHERSHTGERPYVCSTCNKSYLRDSHLQAHVRSHLPDSDRPFECSESNCGKRFWTTQHLKIHESSHKGEKPWKCTETGCTECFSKHYQLRAHLCTVHAPEGTKPYQCDHVGCKKSFTTSQKLGAHSKTHDGRRYTCSHETCISKPDIDYYSNWSALQSHIRAVHPPTCPYPECAGKTFTQQKGLKAHLKLHEDREAEQNVEQAIIADGDDEDGKIPIKKRRGGEYGREWKCSFNGCDKDFKSKKALDTHHNVSHLGKRDFTCPHEGCSKSYGYKHLLQRHLAKSHISSSSSQSESEDESRSKLFHMDIDTITGKAYVERTKSKVTQVFRCPYPQLPETFSFPGPRSFPTKQSCEHLFRRSYDLLRHLRSTHGLDVERDGVDEWVKSVNSASSLEK